MRNCFHELLRKFMEVYRSYPCLWKVKNKEYSHRTKENTATFVITLFLSWIGYMYIWLFVCLCSDLKYLLWYLVFHTFLLRHCGYSFLLFIVWQTFYLCICYLLYYIIYSHQNFAEIFLETQLKKHLIIFLLPFCQEYVY